MATVASFDDFDDAAKDAVILCLDKAIPGISKADALELARMVVRFLGPTIAFHFSNIAEPHLANQFHDIVITKKGLGGTPARFLGNPASGIDIGRSVVMQPKYRPDDNGDYPYKPDVNYSQIEASIRDIKDRIRLNEPA